MGLDSLITPLAAAVPLITPLAAVVHSHRLSTTQHEKLLRGASCHGPTHIGRYHDASRNAAGRGARPVPVAIPLSPMVQIASTGTVTFHRGVFNGTDFQGPFRLQHEPEVSCPKGRQRRIRRTSSRTASSSDRTAAKKGTRLPYARVLERGCHGWKMRSHVSAGSNTARNGTGRPRNEPRAGLDGSSTSI